MFSVPSVTAVTPPKELGLPVPLIRTTTPRKKEVRQRAYSLSVLSARVSCPPIMQLMPCRRRFAGRRFPRPPAYSRPCPVLLSVLTPARPSFDCFHMITSVPTQGTNWGSGVCCEKRSRGRKACCAQLSTRGRRISPPAVPVGPPNRPVRRNFNSAMYSRYMPEIHLTKCVPKTVFVAYDDRQKVPPKQIST